MNVETKTIDILTKVNAFSYNDHFIYTSGRHGSKYINKDALFVHPYETSKIARLFAINHKDTVLDVVIGPALGGILLSHLTAYYLSNIKKIEILSVYAEKTPENKLVLKRNYDIIVKDKNVLIVEDVTTTGGSIQQIIDLVQNAGGRVVFISCIANRNPTIVNRESFNKNFHSLSNILMDDFEEHECPMCKAKVPFNTNLGLGKYKS